MAETDPSIILQAGQINDPQRLAADQTAGLEAMQAHQNFYKQNMLRKIMGTPGALTPDGMVAPQAVQAVMKFDPQTGFTLQKHNVDTQFDQYKLKAEAQVAKLKETEIGQMKVGFVGSAYNAGLKAYNDALKAGRNANDAIGVASSAFKYALDQNGGQLSEDEEKALAAQPFDPRKAQLNAQLAGKWDDPEAAALARRKEIAGIEHTEAETGEVSERTKLLPKEYAIKAEELGIERADQRFRFAKPDEAGRTYNPRTGAYDDPIPSGGTIPFSNLVGTESGGKQFDKSGRPMTSSKGAIGVAQVMPGTAREAAAAAGLPWDENKYRTDREYNLKIGQAYYDKLRAKYGDDVKAAAAYNSGEGRVDKALKTDPAHWLSLMPQETQGYVRKVTSGATAGPGELAPAHSVAGLSADGIDYAAREGLALGKVPPGYARMKGVNQAITNRMAEIAKSEGKNPRDYIGTAAGIKADAGSLSNMVKQTDAINAFEQTTLKNGRAAITAALRAGGPETFRAWRKFVNEGRRQTNDPNVRALDVAIRTTATEYGKAIGGGAMGNAALTDSARKEAEENFTSADSPAVLAAAVDQMSIDMENRKNSNLAQIAEIKGRISGGGAQPAPSKIIRFDAQGNPIK